MGLSILITQPRDMLVSFQALNSWVLYIYKQRQKSRCAMEYYGVTEDWTRLCHLKILYLFICIYLGKPKGK